MDKFTHQNPEQGPSPADVRRALEAGFGAAPEQMSKPLHWVEEEVAGLAEMVGQNPDQQWALRRMRARLIISGMALATAANTSGWGQGREIVSAVDAAGERVLAGTARAN